MAENVRPPVAIRIVRPYQSDDEFLENELETVGKTSVILIGAHPRPTGVILRFEVTLATGAPVLRGEGRVLSHKANAFRGQPGLSLRFTRLDPKSKALVDRAAAIREARAQIAPPSSGASPAAPAPPASGRPPPSAPSRVPLPPPSAPRAVSVGPPSVDGRVDGRASRPPARAPSVPPRAGQRSPIDLGRAQPIARALTAATPEPSASRPPPRRPSAIPVARRSAPPPLPKRELTPPPAPIVPVVERPIASDPLDDAPTYVETRSERPPTLDGLPATAPEPPPPEPPPEPASAAPPPPQPPTAAAAPPAAVRDTGAPSNREELLARLRDRATRLDAAQIQEILATGRAAR